MSSIDVTAPATAKVPPWAQIARDGGIVTTALAMWFGLVQPELAKIQLALEKIANAEQSLVHAMERVRDGQTDAALRHESLRSTVDALARDCRASPQRLP